KACGASKSADKKPRRAGAKKEKPQPKGSNKYLNFKQHDYDFEQMEAMELERRKQEFLARGGTFERRTQEDDSAGIRV
ncbi:MAG: hypothetical protein FWD96_04540, partial [Defluviitaleaceae bacterium]|nr:hypothetical protein [Defluviitaleaceae bacterium]